MSPFKRKKSTPTDVETRDILAALGQSESFLDITPEDALALYRLAYAHALRRVGAEPLVDEIMTRRVQSVEPGTPAAEVARLMAAEGVSGVPVLEGGRLVGVVSIKDFLPRLGLPKGATPMALVSALLDGALAPASGLAGLSAAGLMTAPPLSVTPKTGIGEAARLMDERGINRLPVLEGEDLAGIVTRGDVVRSRRAVATPAKAQSGWRDCLWPFLGSFAAMAALGLAQTFLAAPEGLLLVIAPFAASAVLLYAAPKAPLSQPRNVFFGHALSAFVGVSCRLLLPGAPWLAGALAVAAAIALMLRTRTLHPPGGATAYSAVLGGPAIAGLGYWFVLCPAAAGAGLLLAATFLLRRLPRPGRG